tara:strand:- start:876 stop:1247 length:372 start_codon:yes stop_codon:yes gene_type:complete
MAKEKLKPVVEAKGKSDAEDFLNSASDAEILKFLRRLPMVGAMDGSRRTLTDLIYEMKLWPFVSQAWRESDGDTGVLGRLKRLNLTYEQAEAEFAEMTGEHRRMPRVVDLLTFTKIYEATAAE